ncbi:MAG: hypothetical protein ACOWWR_10985 [Eubacteriales bacterium]
MDNLKEGLVGIVLSIIFSLILKQFAQDGIIPTNYAWIFTAIGVASAISTLFIFKAAGWTFTIGWLIGAWLLKDAMDTGTFLVYFIAPAIILILKGVFIFKNNNS